MPKYALLIATSAKTDLKDIHRFGIRKWGQAKSDAYIESLKENFWLLTQHPLMGMERPELLSGIRSLPVESHILFYRVMDDRVEIIRVLHARQAPRQYLDKK
jgi:toxin ParE1/3/4